MIMIVDYGLGNIQAIRSIYEQLNIEAEVAKTVDQLERADKIILPGVGAFDWAMECLGASGMADSPQPARYGGKTAGAWYLRGHADHGQEE